jgi:hypothetical protein
MTSEIIINFSKLEIIIKQKQKQNKKEKKQS